MYRRSDFNQWRFGANFIPSTAVNQLEMWQPETFDPATIERELGWGASLGMRVMRVYLHDLLWVQNASGFLERIEQYLVIADRFDIRTVFVFFDDCWSNEFALGPQPPPRPGVHNSGWVQSPGRRAADNPAEWARLQDYVQGVMRRFSHDRRILAWDLYNEPGNGAAGTHDHPAECRGSRSKALLNAAFDWALMTRCIQPVTVGVWSLDAPFDELNRIAIDRSEVVSFHCYAPPGELRERVNFLRFLADGRPLLCTEYMARKRGSTFQDCLPLLKAHDVTAIHWGLVAGKTNTIYPWNWDCRQGEPEQWFHDVFRPDGKLLYEEERKAFQTVNI